MKRLLSLLCLVSLPFLAQAQETFETFGNYRVHYSVFNSSFIQPEIAKIYNINRAGDQAMVNISVIRQTDEGMTNGLPASISGNSRNLMQQTKPLEFTEIREQDAVYYLAPVRFTNEEVLHFDISVKVDGQDQPFTLSFNRKLYVD